MKRENKAKVIVITNQKGGVGKSTTAEALAEGLVIRDKKVLLIDLDAQGSVSLTYKVDFNKPNIYDVIINKINAQEAIQHQVQQADIIPSCKNLVRLDMELNTTGKEFRLKEKLDPVLPFYDFIVIDTPPALGIITINALTAANNLIIPAQADMYSLQGIGQLFETIKAVREYTNKSLKLNGILLTRYNSRNILSRDMADIAKETASQIGTYLYETFIREGVALKEAQASQKTIYKYSKKSNASIDYLAFTDEFLLKENLHAQEEF